MQIISTIVPIFIIIFLGTIARQSNFITQVFLEHANRLVYYIAIPAMIFSSISKATLKTQMNFMVILICLGSLILVALIAWVLSIGLKVNHRSSGSFIQSSFHSNLGYIGLAVAFYYLGDSGFVKAAIIAGFIMILQNGLGVFVLQYHNSRDNQNSKDSLNQLDSGQASGLDTLDTLKKTMTNPVILSAMAGILFSLFSLKMPLIIDRSLIILKGMALPLALIIIGASLSFEKLKPRFINALIASMLKLIAFPAIGYGLFMAFNVNQSDYLPGLILLASPTATIAYIMGNQIGGDPDLAAATISISTILSGLTYSIWLSIL